MTYVYAMRLGDTPFVKVGHSQEPHVRVNAVRPGVEWAERCKLLCYTEVSNGLFYESALHAHLHSYHILGEWFAGMSEEMIREVFSSDNLAAIMHTYAGSNPPLQTLGQRITIVRLVRGYSLRELARKSGVNAAYLYRIEQGVNDNPPTLTVKQIATALETSMDYLCSTFE